MNKKESAIAAIGKSFLILAGIVIFLGVLIFASAVVILPIIYVTVSYGYLVGMLFSIVGGAICVWFLYSILRNFDKPTQFKPIEFEQPVEVR